jgi:hypothetical protein
MQPPDATAAATRTTTSRSCATLSVPARIPHPSRPPAAADHHRRREAFARIVLLDGNLPPIPTAAALLYHPRHAPSAERWMMDNKPKTRFPTPIRVFCAACVSFFSVSRADAQQRVPDHFPTCTCGTEAT